VRAPEPAPAPYSEPHCRPWLSLSQAGTHTETGQSWPVRESLNPIQAGTGRRFNQCGTFSTQTSTSTTLALWSPRRSVWQSINLVWFWTRACVFDSLYEAFNAFKIHHVDNNGVNSNDVLMFLFLPLSQLLQHAETASHSYITSSSKDPPGPGGRQPSRPHPKRAHGPV
jgi:hypothetical protein